MVNLLEIFDGDIPVILYLEDTKQKLARTAPTVHFRASALLQRAGAAAGRRKRCNKMTYLCTNGTAWDDFNFSKWYKLQNNAMYRHYFVPHGIA
ncbi:MAG: hypothetical protein ACLVJH_13880 [Faecalibacterium prausnitzii]